MIVLAGTIGAGKTSLAAALGAHFGTSVYYEAVDGNPVLDLYYKDPAKYAFLLQIYFLNKRFASIKSAMRDDNNILDRSIYEDALFLRLNYEAGNVTATELDVYTELLANMMEELEGMPKKRPDLLVFIDVSFDRMLERIALRGRDFEQTRDNPELLAYFRRVHAAYPAWYENYSASPKMRIDGDLLDFVDNPDDLAAVIAQVDGRLHSLNVPGDELLLTA